MNLLKKIKHIHFVGIGGAGMIGIARILLKKGFKISGSDIAHNNDLRKLSLRGAKIFIGHDKKNINGANLLVVSSAINNKNLEVVNAKKNNITIIPRAQMLGSMMKGYDSIAIAGSHGKTTTTSMLAKIFSSANLSPTYVIGGKVLSTDNNSDLGDGSYLIAEADESDGSFIHLQPDVAVITNIDDDHLVHYNNNFEELIDSFINFALNIPFYGYIVLNADDKNIQKVAKKIYRKQITFGKSYSSDYQIIKAKYQNGFNKFSLKLKSTKKAYNFEIKLPGDHNIYNAVGAIVTSIEEGIKIKDIKKGIKEFTGVGRRYQKHNIKVNKQKKLLIDDYGHHPIEIDSNINAIKEEYPKSKICMIFQPHRFSRTAQLFDDFISVLKKIDYIYLLDIYSASEKSIKGIHSRTIYETLKQSGQNNTSYVKDYHDLMPLLEEKAITNDIFVTQGAGSIAEVCNLIRDKWKA